MTSSKAFSDLKTGSMLNNQGLSNLLHRVNTDITAGKTKRLPDAMFDKIAKTLEETVQKTEWTRRPRTWFVLHQINRLDAMEAFIVQGLNDTSLPYKGRKDLPPCLTYHEAEDFIQWQGVVDSDVLHFEEGRHIITTNGDVFFNVQKPALGTGSQG